MTDTNDYLYYLDNEIRYTILNSSNMKKIYDENTNAITQLIYNDNNSIFTDAYEIVDNVLVKQLQSKAEANKNYKILLTSLYKDKDKLALFTAIANMMPMYWDDDLNEYEICQLLIMNEWEQLIKIYKRQKAIELVESCDALHYDMLEVFLGMDKERVYNVAKKIAINKIKRSKTFNYGLGLQLNMKNCGIELEVI